MSTWNRCTYCGRFIGFKEFEAEDAMGLQVTPDSEVSVETFCYFHLACLNAHAERERDRVTQLARDWTY